MYKGLVAFDLDNTLLSHHTWKIPESSLKAIEQLKRNGYAVAIASGRNMEDGNSIRYLQAVNPDVLIHMNGNCAKLGDQILLDHYMSQELLKDILEFCEKNNYAVGLHVNGYDYFTNPDGVVQHDLDYWGSSNRNFRNVQELVSLPVRALAYAGNEVGANAIKQKFPDLQVFMFSARNGADIFEAGFNKADTLMMVADRLGLSKEQVFAFGDSYNDEEMLKRAGCGVAMGNGVPEIKAKADYVTDEIDQEGVYKACLHLGLINQEEC